MTEVARSGRRALRSIAGLHPSLERVFHKGRRIIKRRIRHQVRRTVGQDFVEYTGARFALVASRSTPEPRVGITLRGACDLPSMFGLAPMLRDGIRGSVCIYREGMGAMDARSDILLQAVQGVPEEHTRELLERFPQYRGYFDPRLFDKSFRVPGHDWAGEFPKTVVVLSIGPDLGRAAYRHKEHGYLVDPGGAWLTQPLEKVLADPATARWFKEHFQSVGRMPVEEFHTRFGEVVRLIKERVGAHVLVYNMLTVEPGSRIHNFRFVRSPHSTRRRAFHLALADLSAELDFHIVDVDRVLKESGVREQVDFAHFTDQGLAPIAREAHRILKELAVV
ncbi:MAG: hypothetical protein ACRDXD_15090 [Acidimicrobiia bacterium]